MPSLASDEKGVLIHYWQLSSASGNLGLQICMVVVELVVIFLENHSVEHRMLVRLFKLGISGTRSSTPILLFLPGLNMFD
jgi:hypothetical protein